MKTRLRLSLVIPVYNEEHHLAACLDAVAAQSDKPDEVLVIDNNSTDKSLAIARRYPFVRILKEAKQGVVHARNTGFEAARGDIIGRIDADSILPPEWSCRVRQNFTNKAVAAVTGPTYWYDMPFSPNNYRLDHFLRSTISKLPEDFPWLFGTNMALRRSAWQQVRKELCLDKHIFEDLDIAIHLHRHNLHIVYDKDMRAGMSSRRYDDSPRNFINYMKAYKASYKLHGMRPLGSAMATTIYSIGYVVLWPLRQSYDDRTRTRSVKHLLRGRNEARKNPMH